MTVGSPEFAALMTYFIVRYNSQQIYSQHLANLIDIEHFALLDHARTNPVDYKLGAANAVILKQPNDPIGIPYRGILRRGYDDGLVGSGDGILVALLDSGRAINDDEIEILLQIQNDLADLVRRYGMLILRLRCRQQIKLLEALIFD